MLVLCYWYVNLKVCQFMEGVDILRQRFINQYIFFGILIGIWLFL